MNYIVQQIIYQIYTINIYCIFRIILISNINSR